MTWWSERGLPPTVARRGANAGFTLIEMICVIAVLGIAASVIVGYKPPWSGGLRLRGIAAELASDLRFARSEAIAYNRPITFELNLAEHRYRVGTEPEHSLPPRLKIALLTVASSEPDSNLGSIRFNPDGSSSGGRVTIGDGSLSAVVGVDWLSGRVNVADGE